ncbi:hypothetical protein Tco_0667179 [Tanacetum coccineum]
MNMRLSRLRTSMKVVKKVSEGVVVSAAISKMRKKEKRGTVSQLRSLGLQTHELLKWGKSDMCKKDKEEEDGRLTFVDSNRARKRVLGF